MALTPAPAMADQVVGNLSSFGGSDWRPISSFKYIGVVINAPSSTSLTSFQWFALENGWFSNPGPSINFSAGLYQWDPVMGRPSGSAIWAQSGLTLSLPPGPSDLYPITFSPPRPWIRKTVMVNSPNLIENQRYLFYVRYDNSAANSTHSWCSWGCIVNLGYIGQYGVSGDLKGSNDGSTWSGYPGIPSLAYQASFVSPALVSGSSTSMSNPSVTTLGGGTVVIDAPGVYGTSWSLEAGTQSTIDLGGHVAALSGIFSGPGGLSFANSAPADAAAVDLDGVNTYTGPTVIGDSATVSVNGSIASSSGLTVHSGGVVGGNGQLPATTIASGGVMAPGNSIGTLTVNGDYSLNGGNLAIELQGPQNDQIVVTGTVATFNGTAALISYGGGTAWPSLPYTIIAANASAAFATSTSLTLDQSQITPSALLQLGTTVVQEADGNPRTFDVQWRPNNGSGAVASAMAALGAGNGNGSSAAGVLDSAYNRLAVASAGNANAAGAAIGSTGFTADQAAAAGISSELVQRLANLLAIPSGSQLLQAVNSVTPESYAAFQSVGLNALRLQRETLAGQAGHCQETGWVIHGGGKAAAASGKRKLPLCMFATGGNATSTINSSDGLSGYDSAIAGGFYGVEVQPSRQWTVGAAYGYGTAGLSNLGAGSNSVNAALNSGTAYGVYNPDGNWSIKSLVGYANAGITGRRNLVAVGNGSPITGSTTANGVTAAVLADVAIPLSQPAARVPVVLKPQLGLAYGAYQQEGINESGDPTMNMHVAAHGSQSLVGTVGAEVMAAIPLNAANTQVLRPRLAVAYQVDALANSPGNTSVDATWAGAGGTSLTTNSLGRGTNDVTVSGTLEYVVAKKASVYATASYEAFSTGSQFAYGGGVKLSF